MFSRELITFVNPLERFETIRLAAMRLGDRLHDLSYANPHQATESSARAALQAAIAEEDGPGLQYTPFGGHTRIRRAVADGLHRRFGLDFRYEDVVLTPGATAALNIALRTAGEPGDEVVVPVPCWLDYPAYIRNLGLKPVIVPLAEESFDIDVDAVAAALSGRTCALLLSHPSNPTGRVYSRERLEELAGVLEKAEAESGRTITWISDEAHRDFVADGMFYSPLAAWPASLVIYSYGKYHFLQGQRAGYAAVSPRHPQRDDVAHDLVRWTRVMGYAAPTALMQKVLPRLDTIRHDLGRIDRWRSRYHAELAAAGFELAESDATFFVYAAVPDSWHDDYEFVRALARARVLVLPAPVFHHDGYFRLSLTAPDDSLESALSNLCRSATVKT